MKKRKTYDDQFKARVALEAVKGQKTISKIAAQFEVHPNRIMKWEKQLLENVAGVFSRKQEPEVEEMKELIDKLYKKIGEQDKGLSIKHYKIDFIYPIIRNFNGNIYESSFASAYTHIKKMIKLDYGLYLANKRINQCLFGKLCVTLSGDIIPCQMARSHVIGNVYSNDDTPGEILRRGLLGNYWYLAKDKMETCKNCEYRYGCIDCTILTHNFVHGAISKNLFCLYSPFAGQ